MIYIIQKNRKPPFFPNFSKKKIENPPFSKIFEKNTKIPFFEKFEIQVFLTLFYTPQKYSLQVTLELRRRRVCNSAAGEKYDILYLKYDFCKEKSLFSISILSKNL